jgi:hypothetical protein
MMIDLRNILVDNGLQKEEILQNIEVVSTSYEDAPKLTELLAKCFDLPNQEIALRQLLYANARLDKSVKAIDKRNGDIYGFLIFSIYPVHVGSPIFHINPKLGGFLVQFSQLNAHSFIIDERLRGTSIDKRMLRLQNEYLNQYELIWCAVEESLGTDNYWKRLGFKELFRIPEATFYGLFNKNLVSDNIYSIIDELNHEDNHNKRESGK